MKHESVRNKVSLVGHFSVFTIMLYVHFINMSGLDLPGNRNVLMLHSIMISGTRQARPGRAGQGLPTQTGDQCLPPSFHSSGVWVSISFSSKTHSALELEEHSSSLHTLKAIYNLYKYRQRSIKTMHLMLLNLEIRLTEFNFVNNNPCLISNFFSWKVYKCAGPFHYLQ